MRSASLCLPSRSSAKASRIGLSLLVALTLMLGMQVLAAVHASPAQAATTQGQAIVDAAQAQKNAGYPYCFDGGTINGPSVGINDPGATPYSDCHTTGKVGFDCTGLTLFAVYQGTGNAKLSHDGHQATSGGGQVISRQSDLLPGDVVYFDHDTSHGLGYIDHSGIYMGSGQILSAADEQYGIVSQNFAWYASGNLHFVGGVRYWSGGTPPSVGQTSGLIRVPNGDVFQVAGGAPLHLGSCKYTPNGDCSTATPVGDLSGYNPVPLDGTLLRNGDSPGGGDIFEVVGGAPLHLASCAYTEGANCSTAITIDSYPIAALDHLRPYPADGALLRNGDSPNGDIFDVAGGAPLHLASCAYTPGANCSSAVTVDSGPITGLDHLRAVPADGTLLRNGDSPTGDVFEVAGGAPLHLATCAYTPGGNCYTSVTVDGGPIAGLDHLRAVPADGTLLRNGDSPNGDVFEVAGGAPLHLGTCAYTAGANCSAAVTVDGGPIAGLDHLRAVPADGTLLRNADSPGGGAIYEIFGGAPLYLSTCAYTPSNTCDGAVTVDSSPINNHDHLRTAPADGTTITGMTSGHGWVITSGCRSASSTGGLALADSDLVTAIPTCPTTPPAAPADTTPPTATLAALPTYSLATTLSTSYGGSDAGTGIANFDARYRRAVYNGGFGSMTYPGAWQHTTAHLVSLAAVRGSTVCFSIRSRDKAGNTSGWTPERCTATALDDRGLSASSGWTRATSMAYYAGTITSARHAGLTLARTGVQTRRIAIVATTCPGCGVIGIYWNGKLMKQISLNSSSTTNRRVLAALDLGSTKSGTLTIRTLTAGPVRLDGAAFSRT